MLTTCIQPQLVAAVEFIGNLVAQQVTNELVAFGLLIVPTHGSVECRFVEEHGSMILSEEFAW